MPEPCKMEKCTLRNADLGDQEFDLNHAQNVLQIQEDEKIPVNHCWALPEDSPWQYTNRELTLKKVKKAKE